MRTFIHLISEVHKAHTQKIIFFSPLLGQILPMGLFFSYPLGFNSRLVPCLSDCSQIKIPPFALVQNKTKQTHVDGMGIWCRVITKIPKSIWVKSFSLPPSGEASRGGQQWNLEGLFSLFNQLLILPPWQAGDGAFIPLIWRSLRYKVGGDKKSPIWPVVIWPRFFHA